LLIPEEHYFCLEEATVGFFLAFLRSWSSAFPVSGQATHRASLDPEQLASGTRMTSTVMAAAFLTQRYHAIY